jgi:hypothetical protein
VVADAERAEVDGGYEPTRIDDVRDAAGVVDGKPRLA